MGEAASHLVRCRAARKTPRDATRRLPRGVLASSGQREARVKRSRRVRTIGLLLFSAWMARPVASADRLTVEQIVARCADALGGAGRIGAVETLRFRIIHPDQQVPVTTEIKRPNRIRSEAGYILVFNGSRAGFLKGAPPVDGQDPGPQLVEAESWRDFEVDIAFLFPAFFDYPAELMGQETVDGKTFHKLGVTLPMGIRMTYLLDANTFLPRIITADIPYQGRVFHPERAVGDYQETAGLLFPRSFTSTGWGPPGRAAITSAEVNIPLGNERFEMPEEREGGGAHPGPARDTLPFSLDHNRLIVEARVSRPDGTIRSARAWVDTGNQYLLLSEDLARDLGIECSGLRLPGEPPTADSESAAPPICLGNMPLETGGIGVRVIRGAGIHPGVPADMGLPANALLGRHVVFDYPSRLLTVARPGTQEPRGISIPCRIHPTTGLLYLSATMDGESVPVGVDTGSAGTWISDALTDAWRLRHPEWPHATGAAGSANFWGYDFEAVGDLMRLPRIGIGPLTLTDVAVLGLDRRLFHWYSGKSAGPVAGFLGGNVLKGFRLEIDFPGGMTYWEEGPRPLPADLDTVGFTLRRDPDGGFTVVGVVSKEDGPVLQGVLPGDRLLRVDSFATQGELMGAVAEALRGGPGETRTLILERGGQEFCVEAIVTRLP